MGTPVAVGNTRMGNERCPNCNEKFERAKDRTYRFVRNHYNPICPYRFHAAAHTVKQLRINITGIFERYGVK